MTECKSLQEFKNIQKLYKAEDNYLYTCNCLEKLREVTIYHVAIFIPKKDDTYPLLHFLQKCGNCGLIFEEAYFLEHFDGVIDLNRGE